MVNPGLSACVVGEEALSVCRAAPLEGIHLSSSGYFALTQEPWCDQCQAEKGRHSGANDTICSQESRST